MSIHRRVRAGVPTGGQFAVSPHAESDVALIEQRPSAVTPQGVREAIKRMRHEGRSALERFALTSAAGSS